MPRVLTKRENYRLWQSGAYGNKLRAWRSVEEYLDDGFEGLVALRVLLPAGGGPCAYNLDWRSVLLQLELMVAGGVPRESIMVNEMASYDATVLQGEYFNGWFTDGTWGHLFYSRERRPMRGALAPGSDRRFAEGLASDLLLRGAMTRASWEDWRELLDRYPDHVVEVSVYDRCVGDLPGRNALVWEVRRY